MREIKFRAWNNIVERMSAVYTLEQLYKEKVNFTNLTFMQFSGVKDKNGVEIYEGDIVQYKHGEQLKTDFYTVQRVVDFHNGGFMIGAHGLTDWSTCNNGELNERLSHSMGMYERDYSIEVIGNIYQNKDSL